MDAEAILKYFPETSRLDEKVKDLVKFISSKDDFLRVYGEGDEASARLYVQMLEGVSGVVYDGSVTVLKVLCTALEWIHSTRTLVSSCSLVDHPLKNTNLIILSCKSGKREVLEWLMDNIHIVELLSPHPVLLSTKDIEGHTAVYYAIRSNSHQLLHSLLSHPFSTDCGDEDELISQAYFELITKNIRLSDDTHFIIHDELIALRFNNTIQPAPNNESKIIDWILGLNKILQEEYLEKKVDERFLYILKFIALGIRFLKGSMKSTNNILPWEEIEFCLGIFISARLNEQELNIIYFTVISKQLLMKYLNSFFELLENSQTEGDKTTQKSVRMTLKEVIKKRIDANPIFEDLDYDYYDIKDVYSLNVMKNCIEMALEEKADSQDQRKLAIKRALQVVGEYLKNTTESPNISEEIGDVILLTAPTATRKILTVLRNSLSHSHIIDDINWDSLEEFIMEDLEKIKCIITEILYSRKMGTLKQILSNISKCKNSKEVDEITEPLFCHKYITDVLESLFNNHLSNGYQKFKNDVNEILELIPNITESEKETFVEIETICKKLHPSFYTSLKSLNVSEFWSRTAEDQFLRNTTLAGELFRTFVSKSNTLLLYTGNIYNLLITLSHNSLESRIKCSETRKNIRILIWKFFHLNDKYFIEMSNEQKHYIQGKNTALKLDNENTTAGLDVKKTSAQSNDLLRDQVKQKVETLRNFLNRFEISYVPEKILKHHTNNNSDKLVIEILILDIMSALDTLKCLRSNTQSLVNRVPLLTGRSFRNHLAHGNILLELLFPHTIRCMLIPNANKLIQAIGIDVIEFIRKEKDFVEKEKSNPKHKTQNKNTKEQMIQNVSSKQDTQCDLINIFNEGLHIINKKNEVWRALYNGDLQDLRRCLVEGADIYSRDQNLWTTLHHAARGSCQQTSIPHFIHIIKLLVKEFSMKLDDKDIDGKTALQVAIQYGQKDLVTTLLDLGANHLICDNFGYSPLHNAVVYNHPDIVDLLVEKHNNLALIKTSDGLTALHLAVKFNNSNVVKCLIRYSNIDSIDESGMSPLNIAAQNGNVSIVDTLLAEGANVIYNSLDTFYSLLFCSVEKENNNLLEKFLELKDFDKSKDFYSSSLCIAARKGDSKIVERLISEGVDIEVKLDNMNPLMHAASNNHLNIVKLLIDKGCKVDCVDQNGYTALHLSTYKGCADIVKYFIYNDKTKYDINTRTLVDGLTPLHLSIVRCFYNITELLVDAGADLDIVDNNNHGALHFVVASESFKPDILNLMLDKGANVNIGSQSPQRVTALFMAAEKGNLQAVKILIENKATVNIESHGGTELHVAILNGYEDIVSVLLDNKADVNKSLHNLSPLCIALLHAQTDIAKILIDRGADVNYFGGQPLSKAILNGNKEIITVLLNNDNINVNTFHKVHGSPLMAAFVVQDCNTCLALINKRAQLYAPPPLMFFNTFEMIVRKEERKDFLIKLLQNMKSKADGFAQYKNSAMQIIEYLFNMWNIVTSHVQPRCIPFFQVERSSEENNPSTSSSNVN